MNDVERAVVLTKAHMLKITAAYLRILVDGAADRPTDYERLAAAVRKAAGDMEEQASDFERGLPRDPERN